MAFQGAPERNNMSDHKSNPVEYYTAVGGAMGLCFGAAFGAVFDNAGIGVALGFALGIAIGAGIGVSLKKKQEAEPQQNHIVP